MSKNITICFRTNEDLRSALENISKKERRTLSSTIESIIYRHLQNEEEINYADREKRRYPRKQVSLPALISGPDTDNQTLHAGIILDISLNGIKVSTTANCKYTILDNNINNDACRISIIFTLPDSKKPLTMQCIPQHEFHHEDSTDIGANFIDADFESYQMLQNYLIS